MLLLQLPLCVWCIHGVRAAADMLWPSDAHDQRTNQAPQQKHSAPTVGRRLKEFKIGRQVLLLHSMLHITRCHTYCCMSRQCLP